MNRISIALAMASLALVPSLDAATYAQWSFGEAAGTGLTATANTGSVAGTWSTNLTTGGGALANGDGSIAFRTQGLFTANTTSWVPSAPVVSSGIVFITVKFSQFTLNSSQTTDGELFCLAARNTGGFAQAEIYLRRNTSTNALEVRGRASSTATGSAYVESDYVQVVPTYTAPSGLILTMAVDYTNRTYSISAKVGNGAWLENICSGTIYSGAVFSGLRLQSGNNFNSTSDNVLVDEITVSSVHPGRDAGSSAGTISGSLSVGGSIDSLGNEITFGTGSGLYGAGLLFNPADGGLIFDLPASSGSWVWQKGDTVSMVLDAQNKLSVASLAVSGAANINNLTVGHVSGDGSGLTGIVLDWAPVVDGTLSALILSNGEDPEAKTYLMASGAAPLTEIFLPASSGTLLSTGDVSVEAAPNKVIKSNGQGKIDSGYLDTASINSSVISGGAAGLVLNAGQIGQDININTVGGTVIVSDNVEFPERFSLWVDGETRLGAITAEGLLTATGGALVSGDVYLNSDVYIGQWLQIAQNQIFMEDIGENEDGVEASFSNELSSSGITLRSSAAGGVTFTAAGIRAGYPGLLHTLSVDASEVIGAAVSDVSAPKKIVKTNASGKIDGSFLDLGIFNGSEITGGVDGLTLNGGVNGLGNIVLNAVVAEGQAASGRVLITSNEPSDTPASGALVVAGGVGVGGGLTVGEALRVGSSGGDFSGVEATAESVRLFVPGGQEFELENIVTADGFRVNADMYEVPTLFAISGSEGVIQYRSSTGPSVLMPITVNASEIVGEVVTQTAAPRKLVKTNDDGKIDPSLLPNVIRINPPAGDLSMGDFTAP